MRRRNVLVNIETDDGEVFAYRAYLVALDMDRCLGLCEERAGSGIPKGLYPLTSIFDAKTRQPIELRMAVTL